MKTTLILLLLFILTACGRNQVSAPGEGETEGPAIALPAHGGPGTAAPGGDTTPGADTVPLPHPTPRPAPPPRDAAPIQAPVPPAVIPEHRMLSYVTAIPLRYNEVEPFINGVARVRQQERWGAVDNGGAEVLAVMFAEIGRFYNGVTWAVNEDNTAVLLDMSGNVFFTFPDGVRVALHTQLVVRTPQITASGREHYGHSREEVFFHVTGPYVRTMYIDENNRALFGLTDFNGTEVFPPVFAWIDNAVNPYDRIIFAEYDNWLIRYGVMDRLGHVIVEPMHRELFPFAHGISIGRYGRHTLMGAIDIYGNIAVPFEYELIMPFSGGLALFQSADLSGRFGYMNTLGETVIPAIYPRARSFTYGLAAVAYRTERPGTAGQAPELLWGFIDGTGRQVVPFRFDEAFPFSEGMAAVAVVGEAGQLVWGYINTEGELIEPRFDRAGDFREGYAVVRYRGGYKLIDRAGRIVLDLSHYDAVGDLSEGMLMVNRGFALSEGPGPRYVTDAGLWGFIQLVNLP